MTRPFLRYLLLTLAVCACASAEPMLTHVDGTVLMDARQNAGDRRWMIASTDGGAYRLHPV